MDSINVSFASILSMLAMGGTFDEPKQSQVARVSTYQLPPIAGQWQMQLDKPINASCHERYNFGRNQAFIGSSGREFTYGKYLFTQTSDGLPAIAVQTEYDNNAADCSGHQVDQSGDILVAYVKQEGDIMQWCADGEGKKCEMTLKRVLP